MKTLTWVGHANSLGSSVVRRLLERDIHVETHSAATRVSDLLVIDARDTWRGALLEMTELNREGDSIRVLLTRVEQESIRIRLLESGADECIAFPCSDDELVARLVALARLSKRLRKTAHALNVGSLSVDLDAHRVTLDGREVSLTPYEYDLLRVLAQNAGTVVDRERLMECVRGRADEAFDRSIDVHICHLREKLGESPRRPRWLKTVRGSGYVLMAAPQ